jgi:hypothetical protein
MLRIVAGVALFFSALSVYAQGSTFSYSIEPSNAAPTDVVSLRVDSNQGCYFSELHVVTRNGRDLEIRMAITDIAVCMPGWQTPRLFPLGTFEPGVYELSVVECGNAPVNPCIVSAVRTFTVSGTGSSAAVRIPTLGYIAVFTLIACILPVALLVVRSRQ